VPRYIKFFFEIISCKRMVIIHYVYNTVQFYNCNLLWSNNKMIFIFTVKLWQNSGTVMKSIMNIMKIIKYYLQLWKRIFMFSFFVLVVLFYVTCYFNYEKPFNDDLERTLVISLQHLDEEYRTNIKLTEIRNDLIQKYVMLKLCIIYNGTL